MLISCVMKFKGNWDEYLPLAKFAYNNSYQSSIDMAPYEALYGRRCKTPICWDDADEKKLLGPELVMKTADKVKVIWEKIKTAQDRQKSYVDNRRKDLEFEVGDMVFLKVTPWKGVIRFGKRGKLSPRYIGPYPIIERIGPVAYKLNLPDELSRIHNVFHVSMLRKYVYDPSHVLKDLPIHIEKNLTYEEQPVEILDRRDQVLRTKIIPLVKVLWRNQSYEEATWEREKDMRIQYPHLFNIAGK